MNFRNWLRSLMTSKTITRARKAASKRNPRCRLLLERLETREVPSVYSASMAYDGDYDYLPNGATVSVDRSDFVLYGIYGNDGTAGASASSGLFAGTLLRSSADAGTTSRFGYGPAETAISAAGYADVVHYVGGSPPPTLSFHFSLSGSLFANPAQGDGNPFDPPSHPESGSYFPQGGGSASVRIFATNLHDMAGIVASPYVLQNNSGSVGAYVIEDTQDGALPIGSHLLTGSYGFDSINYANGLPFTGAFHLDFSYDTNLGGYSPGLVLSAQALSQVNFSGDYDVQIGQSLFGHTLSLEAITLPDGTPVDVSQLQFDSGLQFVTAVTPSVSLTTVNATYTGAALDTANLTTVVTPAAAAGSVSYVFYSDAAGQNAIATPINAGTYFVQAFFTSNSADYTNAESGIVSFNIAKANASFNVMPYSGTYDGLAHNISAIATGVGSDGDLSSLVTVGFSQTNAGSYTGTWSFSGNDNYNPANGTAAITISAKSLTVDTTTQGTLNIAKGGSISFALQITAGLVASNNNVAALFNGAVFTIVLDGTSYSLTSTATVTDGTINVSMQMSQGLQNALLTALSVGKTVDFSLSALSNDNDYSIAADAISRLISQGKLKFAVV